MKIKRIIQENSLLSEGVSDILYHYTYIPNLINIFKENKFHASTNLGSSADLNVNKGEFFFFSTQRTKPLTGYGSRHGTNVAIVLDGRKLMQKYKGAPVDYWSYSMDRNDWKDDRHYMDALQSKELEDRFFIKTPTIDNAIKYILEIHILLDSIDQKELNQILKYIKEYNVPTYFYDDKKIFSQQNKSKSINPNSIQLKPEKEKYGERLPTYLLQELGQLIIIDNEENKEKLFNLIDKYYIKFGEEKLEPFKNDIIKKSNENKARLGSFNRWDDYYHTDKYNSLAAYIHNNRTNPHPIARELFKIIVDEMKKNNLKTFKEYMEYKYKLLDENKNGQLRISDYGLKPLWKYAEQLIKTKDPIKKIQYIDQMLNVIHMRGDIAGYFVEGGSVVLSDLSSGERDWEIHRPL